MKTSRGASVTRYVSAHLSAACHQNILISLSLFCSQSGGHSHSGEPKIRTCSAGGFGDGGLRRSAAACGRPHNTVATMHRHQQHCGTGCRQLQRSPSRLSAAATMRSSSRWCSCSTSAADRPLLACCAPDLLSMIRSPASRSERASACARDAPARGLRPIRAQMAENEAIY